MKILWNNEVDKNTITASGTHVDYPLSNLVYPHLSRVFHATDDDDEYILIAGTDIDADSIAIMNHNFTSAAVIKIQGNDTNVWTSPSYTKTLTWTEYTIFEDFTSGQYNYWRLFIDDAANPDGYISIGRLFLGEKLELPGMKPDQGVDDMTTDKVSFSESGQTYGDAVVKFRKYTVNFPYISEAERVKIRAAFTDRRIFKPFPVKMFDLELAMYSVFADVLKWKRSDDENYPWQLQMILREVY